MEVSELPIEIQKYIKFIEYAKQWDSDCNERAYYDILNKMNSNEEVYEKMSRKNPNMEATFSKICADIKIHSMAYWVKRQALLGDSIKSGIVPTKTEMKQMYQQLSNEIEEYYYDLGQLMNKTGMIDVLVERNNKAFDRIGASHFRINPEDAMKEFEIRKYRKPTYSILCMKVVFTINKVIKMMNSAYYAKMLENDKCNSNTNNDKRIKLISHLKTTFLSKALDYAMAMEDKEDEEFEKVIINEYERLFGEEFKKLYYEKDMETITYSYAHRGLLYADKTAWLTNLIELSINENDKCIKSLEPDLKDCGLIKDEKGQWVLGMNVFGYPMPITAHVNEDVVKDVFEEVRIAGHGRKHKVNKYKMLRDKNGKVFPSNVLFRANEKAVEKARKVYAEDKTDPIKKYFYSQVISKEHQDKNMEYFDESELR